LAYALFLPERDCQTGVVILHGGGSAKESHFDFARLCREAGLAALAYDARGHGRSDGPLGASAIEDALGMCALLREHAPRVALRGSSMGGCLAIHAAARDPELVAVVAICPAPSALLARGLRTGRLEVAADTAALEALLAAHPLEPAVGALDVPVLIQHAEGDERVPVRGSRALEPLLRHPASRLDVMPGGDHGSVQHDAAAQAAALDWLRSALG
jgi:pimeloyl-ACP methyl ester carboxylesterase